jgi:hypothetical protein
MSQRISPSSVESTLDQLGKALVAEHEPGSSLAQTPRAGHIAWPSASLEPLAKLNVMPAL